MEATLPVKTLREAVILAATAAEKRSTIPILSMLRFKVSGHRLSIEGTDLDCAISAELPIISGKSGAICVPGAIRGLLCALPNWETIALREAEGRRVIIDMPDGRASLIGVDPNDFPSPYQSYDKGAEFEIGCSDLRKIFERVTPFVSTEVTRYYLNGVMMRGTGGTLEFAATDGHVLGHLRVDRDTPEIGKTIIPHPTILKLLRTLPRGGNIKVLLDAKALKIGFEGQGFAIRSKLIDVQYPDFERVIPAQEKARYALKRNSVVQALQRVSALGDDAAKAVVLAEEADGRLSVSKHNMFHGDLVCAIAGKRIGGEAKLEASVNGDLFKLALTAHRESDVTLGYVSAEAPITIRSSDLLTMVMPMRGNGNRMALPEGAVA